MELSNKKNKLLSLIVMLLISINIHAQVNQFESMYYTNPYLANPSLAGYNSGLEINLAYRKQYNQIPGSPVNQSITLQNRFKDSKAGLGLNLNFMNSGLINTTRIMATYAYHLPVSDQGEIHFGLSLGLYQNYLNNSAIIGDINDPLINRFKENKGQIDSDFGIAYTNDNLTLEGAIINLRNNIATDPNLKTGVNYGTFYTAMAYKINIKENIVTEPKLALRGVKGFTNIIDAGLNTTILNQFNVLTIYHSTKSASFGFGYKYKSKLLINAWYGANNGQTKNFGNGDFELGINYKIN
jgi:type IX secretion system PorP/SprF family membrane protein